MGCRPNSLMANKSSGFFKSDFLTFVSSLENGEGFDTTKFLGAALRQTEWKKRKM